MTKFLNKDYHYILYIAFVVVNVDDAEAVINIHT